MTIMKNDFLKKNRVIVDQYLSIPDKMNYYTETEDGKKVPPTKQYLPGENWPSDHFSLAYDVKITQARVKLHEKIFGVSNSDPNK